MLKKTLSVLLTTLLLLPLFLTGAVAEEGPAELNFWYWDTNMDECYTEMFDAFMAENPNITVKMTLIPWADYWTKLQTALPTGAGPDVFWLNHPNAVTYLPTGHVMSIQDKVDDGTLDMAPFAESLWDPYVYDSQLYCVPIFFDTIAMAYNKQMLADAGYPDGPAADWTWDDMREMALALTSDDVYGLAVNANGQSYSMDYIVQNGGDIYSEDGLSSVLASDENVETIQFMLDLINVDKVSPTQMEQKELTADDMFYNDMLAMRPMGLWGIAPAYEALGDNLGLAPLPMKKEKGTIVHNLGYAIASQTKYPEAAMKLMEYFTGKDHGDRIATVFAPAYADSQQIWFESFPELDLEVYTDGLAYAKGLLIASKNAGQAFSLYEDEMDKLFQMDNPDVKAELTKIQELLDAEIAK